MKKIIASAVGLMMVGGVAATTASAVENQFGGYWRTRAFIQDEFKQDGNDYARVDNRTRLYYTAKFSDNFKFVNKFEFNSNWGDADGGDIGADGKTWLVKNSYADFTLGAVQTKLGIQGGNIARGFIFADDFSGIMVSPKFGNVKLDLGYITEATEDGGGQDFDGGLALARAKVTISDAMSVTPYFVYYNQSAGTDEDGAAVGDLDAYYLGADVDMKMDALKAWGTLIYNGGEKMDGDISGFLAAAGVDAGIAHGQAFYATGDDGTSGADSDAFVSAKGSSYYWSEILGLGIFDNANPGGPNDNITNVAAFNAGVTIKPMDKLTVIADVWYAFLAEDNAAGDDELGLEFDGKVKYKLMDNLTAELVLAYLVVGDAIGDEDVFEGGVRVSLSF